jgi:hypothetical protein
VVVADKVNEMKARSSIFTILLMLLGFFSLTTFAAEEQAGDGCGVDIRESMPAYNVMNSDAGHVVETVLADSCADINLKANSSNPSEPLKYASYCECNKVSPTAGERDRFEKFMKRRVGLKRALDRKDELEKTHQTSSYLIFDSLSKLKDNSISYPEACADLLKLEKADHQACTEGENLKELQSLSGRREVQDIFKRIIPEGNEDFYDGTNFDVISYFGFGGAKGTPNENRLDINFTTEPSLEKVKDTLSKNKAFNVAEDIISPAIGNVMDNYKLNLDELFYDEEVDSVEDRVNMTAGLISRRFISDIAKENNGQRLFAISHLFFGSGEFNPASLDAGKMRLKAMQFSTLNNRSASAVYKEAATSAQYVGSPIFLSTYIKKMMDKIRGKLTINEAISDKEVSENLKGKKISDLFTEEERKEIYKDSMAEIFFKVIKNFKDLGGLCTDYRMNFSDVCGDRSFADVKYNGLDFINNAMAFNPKGAGVKIMCEKALSYLHQQNTGDTPLVELDEKGFLSYLQHLGGIKVDETVDSQVGPRYTTIHDTGTQTPVVLKPGHDDGTNGGGFGTYDLYRGVPVTSTQRIPPRNVSGANGTPVNGNGGRAPASNPPRTTSYQITNFSDSDQNGRILVDAIIKNDEKEIRSVMADRFNGSPVPKPVYGQPGGKKPGFMENLETDLNTNGDKEIEEFISKNFALYDSNDSSKDINTDFYSGDNNIFSNNRFFDSNNVPTRPVDFDELSDEEKKEYNDAMEELDKKIDEGEKLADKGEEKLKDKEGDKEREALQKQLDELRKSIDQLKKKKEGLETAVIKDEDKRVVQNNNEPVRRPTNIEDKKYVSSVTNGSSFRAATIKNTSPSYGGGSSTSTGGGTGGGYTGGNTTAVGYVDGANGYAGTIVTNGNKVGKEDTKKSPGPTAREAVNYDKLILERTSMVLAPDVFSSYGQEQFDQYYRDHGTDPIVVKQQVEVVVDDKKQVKDVYVYYFPELKDGKINYVKRDPAAIMGALQTVKSKKKVDADIELTNREIARHDELVMLFKAVID